MKHTEVFNQQQVITSPFNEKMFIEGLQSQLSSKIFKELINGEKLGIRVTVTMEVMESE